MKGGATGRRPGEAADGPSLSDLGEFGLIRELVSELGDAAAEILLPEGDDAALWDAGGPVLATTDALVEGVHFRTEWTSPEDLGFKAVSVNVSDIAAMGGRPSLALVAVGLGGRADPAWLRALYRGIGSACRAYGLEVAGGDTFSSGALALTLTVLGVAPAAGPVTRAGAREGDLLLVTGELGEAAAGLAYLKARQLQGRSKGKARKVRSGSMEGSMAGAVSRFVRPQARLAEGRAAAAAGASAMIDISDGLAGDALHLAAASGVGVVIRRESLPLGKGSRTLEGLLGEEPHRLALCGGEDYELLIAVPPGRLEDIVAALKPTGTALSQVGQVVSKKSGCVLEDEGGSIALASIGGFDHFRTL